MLVPNISRASMPRSGVVRQTKGESMNHEDELERETREVQPMQAKDHAHLACKMFKRFQLLNKGQRKSGGNDE